MTAQEWYGSLPPEQQEAIWRAGISVEEAFQRATDGSAGGPGVDMGPDHQRKPAGAPETAPGSPIASRVASRPVRRSSLPYEPEERVSEADMPGLPAGPAGDPMAGLQQPESRGRTFLRTLAQPFSGDEGKMRLMQLLGELGQGYLGSRGAAKANRQTRESQALANVVNAVGRGKPGARGAQYEATPGVGQTLLAGLAGAGRMGQEAIATNRTRGQEDWKQGMEEEAAGRQDREVGVAEGRAAEDVRHNQEIEALQKQENDLRAAAEQADSAARRQTLGNQAEEIRLRREQLEIDRGYKGQLGQAAMIRAEKTGTGQGKAGGSEQKLARAKNLIGVLRTQWDKAVGREVSVGSDGKERVEYKQWATGPILGEAAALRPEASVYNTRRRGVAQTVANIVEGRSSDRDVEATMSLIPEITDRQETAEQGWKFLDDLYTVGADLRSRGKVLQEGTLAAAIIDGNPPQIDMDILRAGEIDDPEAASEDQQDVADVDAVNWGE